LRAAVARVNDEFSLAASGIPRGTKFYDPQRAGPLWMTISEAARVQPPHKKGDLTMTNHDSNTSPSTKNAPIAKIKLGRIRANIWQRIVGEDFFYSVSLERIYRDSEGKWRKSQSFNHEDLLVLAKVADMAHTQIMELQSYES
jgi:hypothetical protein